MKRMIATTIATASLFIFAGCTSKNITHKRSAFDSDWVYTPDIKDNYNQSIIDIANQLLKTNRHITTEKIAITSFVDLHQLNKTTHFGRKVSESLYNELHVRGFHVVDPRGTETLRINADGEFFITRDINLLANKRVENSYVLVGTYTKFGKGIQINARMINNVTGEVVSTARSIIDVDMCDIFENCSKEVLPPAPVPTPIVPTIGISDAGCAYVTCPENCYSGACYEGVKYPHSKTPIKPEPINTNCPTCK
ncbi:MAG: hypothetical protein IE909_00915 [Campylobacterales bacterium]|nr:hypothetical protein [Campylobacterales bacterium]